MNTWVFFFQTPNNFYFGFGEYYFGLLDIKFDNQLTNNHKKYGMCFIFKKEDVKRWVFSVYNLVNVSAIGCNFDALTQLCVALGYGLFLTGQMSIQMNLAYRDHTGQMGIIQDGVSLKLCMQLKMRK